MELCVVLRGCVVLGVCSLGGVVIGGSNPLGGSKGAWSLGVGVKPDTPWY